MLLTQYSLILTLVVAIVMQLLCFGMVNHYVNRNSLSLRNCMLCAFLALANISCQEELFTNTIGQSVPVIYFLLDPNDDVQHIRIGKSYLPGSTGVDGPPESDSTIWKISNEIYVEEYANGLKGNTYRFLPDTTVIKDTGFFPVSNLRVYYSDFKPVAGRTYQLYVYFPELNKMVFAKTVANGLPQIVDPFPLSIRKINFEAGQPYTVRWYPGQFGGVYQLVFRVHYRDSSDLGEQFNTADYSSPGIFNLEPAQMLEYGMGGPSFFEAMANRIPVIPGIVREVISVEFILITGGTDLGIHYQSANATGNNFTNLMDYSNIDNGIGVFSSRSELHIPNLALSEVTVDQLAQGDKTHSLGFKDSRGN